MKRPVVVIVVVAVVVMLLGGVFLADRAAASKAESTITSAVVDAIPGATGVSTHVAGIPVATQVARGSLQHVTVTMQTLPSGGIVLDDVQVDLTDVATSSPYVAQGVTATAVIPTAQLQAKLGAGWTLTTDGNAFVAAISSIPGAQARIVPEVTQGKLTLRIDSVSIFGVKIDGSMVPQAVTDKVNELASSVGQLPLGLSLDSVTVTESGAEVAASGQQVTLEQS